MVFLNLPNEMFYVWMKFGGFAPLAPNVGHSGGKGMMTVERVKCFVERGDGGVGREE